MSDEQRLPISRPRSEVVAFDGDELVAVVLEGDGVAVPVRAICAALGIEGEAQATRLREHEVLAQGLRVVQARSGSRVSSMLAILHRYIPFWMATITPGLVSEAVRPKLVRYQRELVEVLSQLYGGDIQSPLPTSADPTLAALQGRLTDVLAEVRLAREALLAAQQQTDARLDDHNDRLGAVEGVMDQLQEQLATHTTITGPQQEVIKNAIQRIAAHYKRHTGQEIYGRLFAQFCVDLRTPKYGLLPAGRYNDALDWLRQQAAVLLPDDPDALPLQDALL